MMYWTAIFVLVVDMVSGLLLPNNMALRRPCGPCGPLMMNKENNFIGCDYITSIVPVVPNKTRINYITNDISYDMVINIYTTYNNKNNLIFLNNGSFVEIYNRTIIYDDNSLQQKNIVSQSFYNRIVEYLRKNTTDV